MLGNAGMDKRKGRGETDAQREKYGQSKRLYAARLSLHLFCCLLALSFILDVQGFHCNPPVPLLKREQPHQEAMIYSIGIPNKQTIHLVTVDSVLTSVGDGGSCSGRGTVHSLVLYRAIR